MRGNGMRTAPGERLRRNNFRKLPYDPSFYDWVDTVLGLVAMGRRTSSTRAEIAKALRGTHRGGSNADAIRLRATIGRDMEAVAAIAADILDLDFEELAQDCNATARHS